jgi:hypothetical protein
MSTQFTKEQISSITKQLRHQRFGIEETSYVENNTTFAKVNLDVYESIKAALIAGRSNTWIIRNIGSCRGTITKIAKANNIKRKMKRSK